MKSTEIYLAGITPEFAIVHYIHIYNVCFDVNRSHQDPPTTRVNVKT